MPHKSVMHGITCIAFLVFVIEAHHSLFFFDKVPQINISSYNAFIKNVMLSICVEIDKKRE